MKRISAFLIACLLLLAAYVPVTAQTPAADTGDPSAFASGLNAPATFFDSRGNPILTMQVTGIEMDWQDYDAMSAPERNKIYVKVDLQFTNLTDRAETVMPYTFTMVDSTGIAQQMAYLWNTEDIMMDDVSVDGGATVEGSIVFMIFDDLSPSLLIWQPDFTTYVVVYVGE